MQLSSNLIAPEFVSTTSAQVKVVQDTGHSCENHNLVQFYSAFSSSPLSSFVAAGIFHYNDDEDSGTLNTFP
jgi:hypothetical protein